MLIIARTERGKGAPLRRAKSEAADQIVKITSEVRQAFVTPITGQEMTYQEKERQAIAYLALSVEPDPEDPATQDAFGFILGEVGITGQNPNQVAQVVTFKASMMRQIGPKIERLRLQADADLEAASDEAGVAQLIEFFAEDMKNLLNG